MAIETIPINSGTGPSIAVDIVGTNNYQIVKVVQAGDGSAGGLADSFKVTGTNFTVASDTTVVALPVISGTGLLLAATTAGIGAVVSTAHSSRWDAYAVVVDSVSAIVKTSGAHTLYVTDLLVSVDVPMTVGLLSAATTKLTAYLATKGGFALTLKSPMVLNSNQSLMFEPLTSGSASCFAAGYTVT